MIRFRIIFRMLDGVCVLLCVLWCVFFPNWKANKPEVLWLLAKLQPQLHLLLYFLVKRLGVQCSGSCSQDKTASVIEARHWSVVSDLAHNQRLQKENHNPSNKSVHFFYSIFCFILPLLYIQVYEITARYLYIWM